MAVKVLIKRRVRAENSKELDLLLRQLAGTDPQPEGLHLRRNLYPARSGGRESGDQYLANPGRLAQLVAQ